MDAAEVFTFLHLLSVFWYVAGLAAVQIPLVRAWQSGEVTARWESLEEASHYQGVLLVPGAIAAVATGLFLWAQLDYSLVTTGWLIAVEALYIATLLVCLPLIGMGLRRARLAALQARRAGRTTPELEQAMADNVPLVFSGIATLLVPAMTALAVFRPG
ncbi:MAG: DUF2269 family protein [Dehalococcoidia bacterium]|nr:DUF2269 family protein [Dehalococcoidia bacterium]